MQWERFVMPSKKTSIGGLQLGRPGPLAPISPESAVPQANLALTPGSHVGWGTCILQVVAVRDQGRIQAIDVSTNEHLDVPIEMLHALPGRPASVAFDRVNTSSETWHEKRLLAQDFEVHIELGRLPKAVSKALAEKHGLSIRTIQRKRVIYQRTRRASSLIGDPGGRRPGSTQLDPRTERVVHFVIERRYARREYVSQLEVAERARSICRRLGWPVPGHRTVARRIRAVSDRAMDNARQGAKRADAHWRPVPGRLFVERPLDVCQIDHTLVDVMVVSDDRRTVLGRPWLTVAIDVATRCVLGIYLTMDAPSSVSVALCLEHAMLPKANEKCGRAGWPQYGKVRLVLTDNAKEFHGDPLESGCAEHGIALEFRPPGQPRFGGHIERMMGTLMRMVHGLPGTTFSNTQARGNYPSERRAAMTLGELRQWLVTRICAYYHVRRHRMLGVAPLVAWDRAWTQPSGELAMPALIAEPDQLRVDFLPMERRMIRRDGITFRNSRYWHPAMADSVGHEHFVAVRFHPYDLSRVWFRDAQGMLIEAPAVAGPGIDRMHAPHTAQETLALEAALDEGFATSDRLEADAHAQSLKHPRTATESKPRKGRGGRARRAPADPANDATQPDPVAPNRASIRTEEL
ncbi:Mu transposase C-terminal domain-containing protein [Luteibacter sp. 3190]|uniref:Mu transposase C-terminal domain-containing protein n=1 Tax=Luteibacter sp. 3190 TaxID=2817736 RepID=UPI00285D5163|nr:Mu transposase C-terminal domain-containing protein [Luteibacter sp. 3190]MDR6935722.1 putative transposase [Luteibacter sp. 3190]